MSHLPEFAEAEWRGSFLPTLYDKFFSSDKPFDAFCHGSDQFVALLQVIIEEVYPNVEYTITSSDAIYLLKWSNIGSNAINLVKKQLNTFKDEQAAKDWLWWALRVTDGPLFFKEPSPMGSPIDQKDLAYEFPGGRLLSPFIINLATPLLSLRAGSVLDNGYPKGLVRNGNRSNAYFASIACSRNKSRVTFRFGKVTHKHGQDRVRARENENEDI
ncbi:hypothetical protein BYT27DRAFT_7088245 [Phlegmacium glaucopus]|nr:hypothetical protein BYT27DRAFT_7088245 [Phlegmacium glaucopus]